MIKLILFSRQASFLTAESLSTELCDTFLHGLVSSCQLLVYCTTTVCERRLGYTATRRNGYAQSLCRQAYADLLALTNDVPGAGGEALLPEREEQEELCDLLSSLYDTSRPEEDKVTVDVCPKYTIIIVTIITSNND